MTGRILVVDDVKANVRLLEARLGAEYFDVRTASSGAEALSIVATWPCDIILLDVMMPGMDGFEVCRRLKADPRTAHIPVVMITALDRADDRIKGLRVGADEFLTLAESLNQPAPLDLLERDGGERTFELDAWARFDLPSEDYYDLEAYPEGYTAYDGSHVWRFIYDNLSFAGSTKARRTCIGGICPEDDENGWRAVFDRSISGMHASIACHVVDDFSEDDDECLAEFRRRLQPEAHPERRPRSAREVVLGDAPGLVVERGRAVEIRLVGVHLGKAHHLGPLADVRGPRQSGDQLRPVLVHLQRIAVALALLPLAERHALRNGAEAHPAVAPQRK